MQYKTTPQLQNIIVKNVNKKVLWHSQKAVNFPKVLFCIVVILDLIIFHYICSCICVSFCVCLHMHSSRWWHFKAVNKQELVGWFLSMTELQREYHFGILCFHENWFHCSRALGHPQRCFELLYYGLNFFRGPHCLELRYEFAEVIKIHVVIKNEIKVLVAFTAVAKWAGMPQKSQSKVVYTWPHSQIFARPNSTCLD